MMQPDEADGPYFHQEWEGVIRTTPIMSVGEVTGKNSNYISVPVFGRHAGINILPLFSQYKAGKTIDAEKIPDLDKRFRMLGWRSNE